MRLVSYLRYVLGLGGASPRDTDPDILRSRDRTHRLRNRAQIVLFPSDENARVRRLETEVEVKRIGADDARREP